MYIYQICRKNVKRLWILELFPEYSENVVTHSPFFRLINKNIIKPTFFFCFSQALCKLLKNSITTLVDDCVAILPVVLDIIPQLYEVSLNSNILDLVKQVRTKSKSKRKTICVLFWVTLTLLLSSDGFLRKTLLNPDHVFFFFLTFMIIQGQDSLLPIYEEQWPFLFFPSSLYYLVVREAKRPTWACCYEWSLQLPSPEPLLTYGITLMQSRVALLSSRLRLRRRLTC